MRWFRSREDGDFDQEMESHLAMLAERFLRQGMTPEDARLAARRQFGNTALLKETRNDMNPFVSLERLWYDIRFGVRALKRNPGFTAVIVLTFMLAIGINTALFSVIYAVLLKPLPYRDPDRLLFIAEHVENSPLDGVGSPDFEDWRERARSFETMAGISARDMPMTMNGDTSDVRIARTLESVTGVLGVSPAVGRDFLPDEVQRRWGGVSHNVVLIGDHLFRQHFGGDPAVLGKTLVLDKIPYVIIGVLPTGLRLILPGFGVQKEVEAIINADYDVARFRKFGPRAGPGVQVIGRLRPGVKLETARVEIETIRAAIAQRYPRPFRSELVMMPLADRITGSGRPALLVLWAAVGFVLLVACVNVANLLLARGAVRARETAVRAALGAGRMRLMRQFLTESILLAFAGGTVGIALAAWAVRLIVTQSPIDVARMKEVSLDWNVLLFSAAVCVLTGTLCGLAPALESFRSYPVEMLKEGKSAVGSRRRHRLHGLLVVSELALALVLVIGAGLMLKSLWIIRDRTAAFAPDHVLTTSLNVRDTPGTVDKEQYLADLANQLEAIRGVRAAAVFNIGGQALRIFGLPVPPSARELMLEIVRVTPHYPAAAGMRLRSGRWLTDNDRDGTPHVMVVNDAFVRWYQAAYPGSGPIIGRQIDAGTPPFTIVGVIGNGVGNNFGERPDADAVPAAFVTHGQWSFNGLGTILMRTSSDPMALADPLRKILNRTPQLRMSSVETVDAQLSAAMAPRRFQATLLVTFGALALLLAMVGAYGVLSYAVTERRQEIGVRMALGATDGDVLRMVLKRAARLVGAGVAVGWLASAGLTRLMTSMLYGLKPTDPWTYAAASVLLVAVAMFAAWLPARRATQVDPIAALRYE